MPFDAQRLETRGEPRPVLSDVLSDSSTAGTQFAVSNDGTLVYVPGEGLSGETIIDWMDREGNVTPLRAVPGGYRNFRFSPDGSRLAMDVFVNGQRDLWIYDWARDAMSRLTFDPGEDTQPVWAPDGRRIAYGSTRSGKGASNLHLQVADGTGEIQRLSESENQQFPTSWHPSGGFLAFAENVVDTSWDIRILDLGDSETSGWKPGATRVLLGTPFSEREAAFSPDGRFLAYQSNESGRYEVYVRPFPGPGGKWQVSVEGGHFPTWSRNGRELFFLTEDQKFRAVAYAIEGDSFRADKPRPFFDGSQVYPGSARIFRYFDLHPDGQRFALRRIPADLSRLKRDHVTLIFNFFDELRNLAPEGR